MLMSSLNFFIHDFGIYLRNFYALCPSILLTDSIGTLLFNVTLVAKVCGAIWKVRCFWCHIYQPTLWDKNSILHLKEPETGNFHLSIVDDPYRLPLWYAGVLQDRTIFGEAILVKILHHVRWLFDSHKFSVWTICKAIQNFNQLQNQTYLSLIWY